MCTLGCAFYPKMFVWRAPTTDINKLKKIFAWKKKLFRKKLKINKWILKIMKGLWTNVCFNLQSLYQRFVEKGSSFYLEFKFIQFDVIFTGWRKGWVRCQANKIRVKERFIFEICFCDKNFEMLITVNYKKKECTVVLWHNER